MDIQSSVFSDEISVYPNFKEDYKWLMETCFDKNPFALRSCLSGQY